MMHHSPQIGAMRERLDLGERGRPVLLAGLIAGAVGLVVALILGFLSHDHFSRFFHAYLAAWAFVLSIALGALFFVLLQHVTKAGWSVGVRRLAENLSATLPAIALMSLPILLSVALRNGALYPWALPLPDHDDAAKVIHAAQTPGMETADANAQAGHAPGHLDEFTLKKRPWLNPLFFIARAVAYLAIWSAIAAWYRRTSIRQDQTGDPGLTRAMERWSAPLLIVYGLTVTLAAFDLLMSLDPHWYSTIYGVYFFSGCAVASFAAMILMAVLLQKAGFLRESITPEHYHDLGKLLFAFVFFWGYIAFSQYMLIWYGNIPEETAWLARRGATSVDAQLKLAGPWGILSLVMLFGNLLIPFGGLLSRHVKRRPNLLLFWAVWALAFHWLDVSWLVLPEHERALPFGALEIAALLGLSGLFLAAVVRASTSASLRPARDPRLEESLAFQNV